ncbi:MAG: type II toxin-antitoxin system HicB family antitoxin [Nitrospinae bacterium]|nr:type II toxin-antitoxin system HicB family antitoxin [Nitrospinota bacterium]
MRRQYTVIVERHPETGWLVGEVVELEGCYTQAPGLPALERNIKEAIRAYLAGGEPDAPLPDFVGALKVEAGQ